MIDFCLMKVLVADPSTNFTSLQLSWASKTNCDQRAGRAGRVRDGRVYRLVTDLFYVSFGLFTCYNLINYFKFLLRSLQTTPTGLAKSGQGSLANHSLKKSTTPQTCNTLRLLQLLLALIISWMVFFTQFKLYFVRSVSSGSVSWQVITCKLYAFWTSPTISFCTIHMEEAFGIEELLFWSWRFQYHSTFVVQLQ